jgi:nitroreductase
MQAILLAAQYASSSFNLQPLFTCRFSKRNCTCPMVGFSPFKVAKILSLKRGVVIPLVIAIGKRNSYLKEYVVLINL